MAQPSRLSLDSEPDLVAYDSSSILPAAGAGYSYGPPQSGSPSDNMSRLSLDKVNGTSGPDNGASHDSASATSSGYSNRSRARATSMASKFSNSTLPLYSARDPTSGSSNASTSGQHAVSKSNRRSTDSTRRSDDDEEHDDDDYEDYSDEDDLEMDTLNKNSGGKGGWKMVANSDTPLTSIFSPSAHTHPPGRRSMSDGHDHLEKTHASHPHKNARNSRFERFDRLEVTAMIFSLALVTFLTIASLQICFNGS